MRILTFSITLLLFLLLITSCASENVTEQGELLYESDNLKIKRLAQNTYVHTSYLQTNEYGKVPCNGMIVINGGKAIVIDTPADIESSNELLEWIQNPKHSETIAVVPTHFHADCLGGLEAFHKKGIASYANDRTIKFAEINNYALPKEGFDKTKEMSVGDETVIFDFLGEGHTKDNVVAYVSGDQIMFGGCLIKSNGGSRGNLEDANISEWSKTVESVKAKYRETKVVIPGHGKWGGQVLLDYTIDLFDSDRNE